MRLLSTYCCQGGDSMGYADAGFHVVGVDLEPQPRYPFEFHQGDAIKFILAHGHEYDVIHASPPCQLYSKTHRIMKSDFPDLIGPTREALIATGKPYVIENVEDARAELRDPVTLCGSMFGLRTYRHRLFESNLPLVAPAHPAHLAPNTKMGRRLEDGHMMHVVGNFTGVDTGREVMGMPWANRDGLREAIPPVYAEWVGRQISEQLAEVAA